MLAALMDDKGTEGDDLMGAARSLCGAFSEMLRAAEPQTNEVFIQPYFVFQEMTFNSALLAYRISQNTANHFHLTLRAIMNKKNLIRVFNSYYINFSTLALIFFLFLFL